MALMTVWLEMTDSFEKGRWGFDVILLSFAEIRMLICISSWLGLKRGLQSWEYLSFKSRRRLMGKRKMDLPDESLKSEDKNKKEPGTKPRREIPDLKRNKHIKKTPPAPVKDESDASSEYEQNEIEYQTESEEEDLQKDEKSPDNIQEEQYEQKEQKKPKEPKDRFIAEQSSHSMSDDDDEDLEERRVKEKKKNNIHHLIEEYASQSDNDEEDDDGDSEEELIDGKGAGQRRAEASQRYYKQAYDSVGKDKYKQMMQEIQKMTDAEVKNKYAGYHDMLDEQEDDQDMGDLDLFQVKCKPGTEEDLVQKMMNKAAYVHSNPGSYIWNVISAFCRPKRFVGFIFLEANNVSILETSIKQFKAIKTSTLQKIEFEIFSHLFGDKAPKTHDYKSEDYIKIKTGVYAGDLAQITKVHKNGVIVQVVPRINFTELAKRLKSYESNYARLHTEEEIMKGKNMMLKEFMNPRATNLKDMVRPAPVALLHSDFEPYGEFEECKKIKLTSKGFLLVRYSMNEIEYSKITIDTKDMLALNSNLLNLQPAQLEKQAQKTKLGLDVKPNDLVQVVFGDFNGVHGSVVEILPKMLKIKSSNIDLNGLIIEQVEDYVEKWFQKTSIVMVIAGEHKGEECVVVENNPTTVMLVSDNKLNFVLPKRSVFLKDQLAVAFKNDIDLNIDDLIRVRTPKTTDIGIVCKVMKNYVDYVTTRNVLNRASNEEIQKLKDRNTRTQSSTADGYGVSKDCVIKIWRGKKEGITLKVKQVYYENIFLQDEAQSRLFENWVENARNCDMHVQLIPRGESKFLNEEVKSKTMYQPRPNFKPRTGNPIDDKEYQVGRYYRIPSGIYNGVRGYIIAAYPHHIEVKILNGKILKIERSKLQSGIYMKPKPYMNSNLHSNSFVRRPTASPVYSGISDASPMRNMFSTRKSEEDEDRE